MDSRGSRSTPTTSPCQRVVMSIARKTVNRLSTLIPRRSPWSAEREYSYYTVDREILFAHRQRQERWEREAYFVGLRIAKALDILNVDLLRGANIVDLGAGECLLSAALAHS